MAQILKSLTSLCWENFPRAGGLQEKVGTPGWAQGWSLSPAVGPTGHTGDGQLTAGKGMGEVGREELSALPLWVLVTQ